MQQEKRTYTSFAGHRRVASGDLHEMLLNTKQCVDAGEMASILIFEDRSGQQIDFDFSGTADEVLAKLAFHPLFAAPEPSPFEANRTSADAPSSPSEDLERAKEKATPGPGRPKLGVVCREVSLLPRHWDWLGRQPGGASATLRRLVEHAEKTGRPQEAARNARDAASKFMWAMAGNFPGFEEASRALFARDQERLRECIREWPADVREYLERLAEPFMRFDAKA